MYSPLLTLHSWLRWIVILAGLVAFIRARWLYLTGDIVAAVQKLREIHAEREALARHTAGEVSLLLGKALKAEDAAIHRELPTGITNATVALGTRGLIDASVITTTLCPAPWASAVSSITSGE